MADNAESTEKCGQPPLTARCPRCGYHGTVEETFVRLPDEHPLAYVRRARGWSYQQLARQIARRARELGAGNMAAERQKVWRWEHRGVTPDRPTQQALANLLGVADADRRAHPWPAWLLPPDQRALELAAPDAEPDDGDPWEGTVLEAMYGGSSAPRCAACRRPYSQQEAAAGLTTCEHCPAPARRAAPAGARSGTR